MTYDEAVVILGKSARKDWISNAECTSFTYKNDLCLHIVLESTMDRVNAEWVGKVSPMPAYKIKCNVFYNQSFVLCVVLAKVEGGKARLPIPADGTQKVRALDLNVARICDASGMCLRYLKKFGLDG